MADAHGALCADADAGVTASLVRAGSLDIEHHGRPRAVRRFRACGLTQLRADPLPQLSPPDGRARPSSRGSCTAGRQWRRQDQSAWRRSRYLAPRAAACAAPSCRRDRLPRSRPSAREPGGEQWPWAVCMGSACALSGPARSMPSAPAAIRWPGADRPRPPRSGADQRRQPARQPGGLSPRSCPVQWLMPADGPSVRRGGVEPRGGVPGPAGLAASIRRHAARGRRLMRPAMRERARGCCAARSARGRGRPACLARRLGGGDGGRRPSPSRPARHRGRRTALNAAMADGRRPVPARGPRRSPAASRAGWSRARRLAAEERLKERLAASRARRRRRRASPQWGTHRSDLDRDLSGSRTWAGRRCGPVECSTGEQRALLLSITLAEARLTRGRAGQAPILLLGRGGGASGPQPARGAVCRDAGAGACSAWLSGAESEGVPAAQAGAAQFIPRSKKAVLRSL